ncbi:retrovirus-related pol polyprotein from transposon TNT 1-94 [Tanacetum coccineum]
MSTAFFSSSIVQDFQDSPDDEEDTRSSHEYLNDLEEEYQARALLSKSKRFFKKGTQRFSSAKATDQNECYKCGKKGHFARDCWSKTSVSTYQSPFQPKPLSSLRHKPKLRPTKDFKANYNKVKAKLNKEEVSSDDNEMVEVKVLMALAEENNDVSKEGAKNSEWVNISMRKVHTLLEMEDNDDRKVCLYYFCIDLNYVEEQRSNLLSKHRNLVHELNACKEQLLVILPSESQRNTIDPSVAVTDSLTTNYDSADESSVCSTSLPPLKTLDGAKPILGPKTIKSILRLKSTFKAEALKSIIINEPSSAPAKGNKSSSALKVYSAFVGKLKSVKIEDDPPLAICDIRKPIWYLESGCSSYMTGVKSYLHKYVEQPGPKVVFGDDFTCTTEGYCSIKCNGIIFTKVAFVNGLKYNLISISQLCDAKYIVPFDEKKGTIFNSNKEIVMIAPRLWHKRLAHLNFKTINKLAKQNLVIGLPSLVYSKDKPCSSCEKGKHHRASFKTKQTSSIKKCLHLLHMDLFRPVTPRFINHEKYTLVIVDEYSRNRKLVNFCGEKGISQNFSSLYTPKQNGVAERKNKTLIEAARTMLLGSVFSKNIGLKL